MSSCSPSTSVRSILLFRNALIENSPGSAILRFGIFDNASGSEVYGRRYSGRDEIRGYFETLFATTSNVKWAKSDIRIAGHKVYAEWLRTATNADGVEQAWQGMDVYTFEGNLVAKKDTYIKVVLPSA